jgi:hypothetical protein
MMFSIKQMDLLHRSEISHETQMVLYGLAKIKGDHNDPFVVRKDEMARYIENTEKTESNTSPEEEVIPSPLDVIESFVSMMKTNNLYIQ